MAGPQPGEVDPVGDVGLFGPLPQAFDKGRLPVKRPDADTPPQQVHGGGECGEQHVVALVCGHRGDAQQFPAALRARGQAGPGRRRAPRRTPCWVVNE